MESFLFWTMTYPAGMFMVYVVFDLVRDGLIEIRGWDKFPHGEGGVLLVPNHPSLIEPFIMIALFVRALLINPKKLGPYTIADDNNFVSSPLCWPVKSHLFPIIRKENKSAEETAKNVLSIEKAELTLKNGGNVLIFAEGTRSYKAKEVLTSPAGSRIGKLQGGLAVLVTRSKPKTVPVWVEIKWLWKITIGKKMYRFPRKVLVNIGDPIRFDDRARPKAVLGTLETTLLELGDQLKTS